MIILDIMLPKLDGLSIMKRLRESGRETPILLLTAKSEVEDRILGLNTRADESVKTKTLTAPKGRVEFDHVRFGYDEDSIVIEDFSAKVEPGQKIAIVGSTGAGKTTMVNRLMRFYEIESNEIRIDGVPISSLTRENDHSLFGMVLRDSWLFNGTIR